MATEIRFVEGPSVTVVEDYRDVYEKFVATNWQLPCEFTDAGDAGHPVAINPAYVVCFRSA